MTQTPPILGHDATFLTLQNLLREGRLPHALLFTGPEGIGKQLVARQVAGSLLCQKAPEYCGRCPSCHLIAGAKHPDLSILQPEAGRIKIDTIRELKKDLVFSPFQSSIRVVLILDAHTMNAAAANALLKTLEEPPAESYFILTSHAPGWIPKTIISRCQSFRFSPLSEQVLQQVLAGQKISPKILALAQGSARRALSLSAVAETVPPLERLFPGKGALAFDQAYSHAQQVVEAEQLSPFLEALLAEAHRLLTQGPLDPEKRFELLVFADRIQEIRKSLRINANAKLHLTRLLLHFQEPWESRL